jgi:hypothetical protein
MTPEEIRREIHEEYLDVANDPVDREKRQALFEESIGMTMEEVEADLNGSGDNYEAYINDGWNVHDSIHEEYLDILADPMDDDFSVRRQTFFERSIGMTLEEYEEVNKITPEGYDWNALNGEGML